MSEKKDKTKSITYIKNGKYLFNIIKVIPHSTTNIEKIGITIYKKTLEISILNKDCIDLLLNTNSNFMESYANICFLNIHGILCFLYASNKDIKEKERLININDKTTYKICRIDNIHCFTISYFVPPKLKKLVKEEFEKIGKFLVGEELYFCHSPFRFDLDIPSQLKVFQDYNVKYKLCEKFQYNEDFSPLIFKKFLTPIVKGFYKRIYYNNLFNDKDNVDVSIKYKIYEINKYLIEVELFITPVTNQKFFQVIFYIYYNESSDSDKIIFLKKIIENWNNNINNTNIFNNIKENNSKNEGLIINFFNNINDDENEDIKNKNIKEEIEKYKNIDFINIKNPKEEEIENILNSNVEKIKTVGYNYQYNNIDYNYQNKLFIIMINDLNLFSLAKYVSQMLYGLFLSERGFQKIIINNSKEEIIKNFKIFEKKILRFNQKFPERLKLQIIKDENDLKNILKFEENEEYRESIKLNLNNKKDNKGFEIENSKINDDKDFPKIGSLEKVEKIMANDSNKNYENHLQAENNNNIILNTNENLEGENLQENNNSDEEDSESNEKENNNINDNNIIEENNILSDNIYEAYNEMDKNSINNNYNKSFNSLDNNQINYENNNPKDLDNKNNKITIFIGTFNVNALESDLIKKINLDPFLFPEKINNYFTSENYPTFYCIGLEETIELNPKNVFIKPKNKAELWEEKITEELQKKYNYFLQCKEQLVGVLLLFYVKATEIKYINNIHIEKLKSGFMGCGNKGCCFLDFEYKKLSFGFCSCHLPAGQNKKNFLDRKETFKHILDFQVNKNIYEFYKNDFFFIFGDLNFRTQIFGLVDLQNHIKIILGENKFNKDGKKKKHFRFSLDSNAKKNKNKHKKEKSKDNLYSENLFDKKISDNINNDKNVKKGEKEDYSNYYTNRDNDKKQLNNMDENIFIQYFFDEFLADEELKKLREKELFIYDVDEADITFPPTYKYTKGTNFYNLSKRVPSWTDRILFKKGEKITSIYYDRVCINFSDHKPIVGLFEINIDE